MRAMKVLLPALAVAIMAIGCNSESGGDTARHPKPEGKYIPAIDAAGQMQGPNQRAETLSDIAAQSDLTEPQQLYLVSSVAEMRWNEPVATQRGNRMTSADTRRVLVTLLRNPVTTRRTKQLVAETLPSLKLSEDDERAVTRAMM
jgi:hypothetical protein